MNMQETIDKLSEQWAEERSNEQMTLCELIARLEGMDGDSEIDKIEEPHSNRGYYSDLGLTPVKGRMKVSEALKLVKECLGKEFYGYKGGDFTMTKTTPLWISEYGLSGLALVGIDKNGSFITKEDEY